MAKDKVGDEQREGPEHVWGDGGGKLAAEGAGVGETALEQANEALHGLRGAIDRASHSLREWGRASGQWSGSRAVELGKGLRGQGERAAGGIAHQVEQNPLTSVTLAFALGVLCAMALRR
jgi:hypothetical protein